MRQLKACGFLVTRGDPIVSFLLMEHAHRLDLPKGHVEPGESEMACALRELQEETGIAPNQIEVDPSFRFETEYEVRPERFRGERCHKTTVIFWGRLVGDVPIHPTEHAGYRWLDWRPPHQIQPETIDPLLAQLRQHLEEKAQQG